MTHTTEMLDIHRKAMLEIHKDLQLWWSPVRDNHVIGFRRRGTWGKTVDLYDDGYHTKATAKRPEGFFGENLAAALKHLGLVDK